MIPGISVVIPTVAPRRAMLREALRSVADQTLAPDAIIIQEDVNREGAAVTRQKGTDRVDTDTVAFLDDDDVLYPQHLERLHATMQETGADLVYGWFDVQGGTDPFPQFEGLPWDSAVPRQFPVTYLARTEAIRVAGGWTDGWDPANAENPGTDEYGNRAGEDFRLTLRLVANGAKIVHLPERTWGWRHHVGNTSGLPSRVHWNA